MLLLTIKIIKHFHLKQQPLFCCCDGEKGINPTQYVNIEVYKKNVLIKKNASLTTEHLKVTK